MATKKGGLGRGLDSLFVQSAQAQSTEGDAKLLKISEIMPDENQPRKNFEQEPLSQLAKSIEEHGVLQPIVVRQTPSGAYYIVAGERRWRAARLAGLSEIPVQIMDLTEQQAMEIALIENLQREDLDPIEEAQGIASLIKRCNYTQETAAKQLAKSRSAVTNSLRLLQLPKSVMEMVRKNELSIGHAKVILSLDNAELQKQAAKAALQQKLNVRQTEALCKKLSSTPKQKKQKLRPTLPSEVEISLQDVLGTQVKVQYKDGKGILNICFNSDEQLKAFANLLGEYKK